MIEIIRFQTAPRGCQQRGAPDSGGVSYPARESAKHQRFSLRWRNAVRPAFALAVFLAGIPVGAQTPTRISGDQTRILTNIQAVPAYTIQTGDCGKLVSFANPGAVAVTLPQAGTTIASGCWIEVQNTGAGVVTITPDVSTIDGSASVRLTTGTGLKLIAASGQYYTQRGQAGSASVNTSSAAKLAYYTAAGTTVSGSGCSIGGAANSDLTCGSLVTNGTLAGEIDLYPAANSTNYVGLSAPSSVSTTYTMQLPSAAPSDQVLSFGPPLNGVAYGSWLNAIILTGVGSVAAIPAAFLFSGKYYLATDSADCVTGGASANTLCRSTGAAWTPISGGTAGGGNSVSGGSSLTTNGAVPFENGSPGAVTQDSGFVYDAASHRLAAGTASDSVTIGKLSAGYSGLWARTPPSATNYVLLGDGTSAFVNAPSGGIYFRIANQDIMKIAPGSTTLQIPSLAAQSGTRYVCVNTAGNLVSQVTPCSGT